MENSAVLYQAALGAGIALRMLNDLALKCKEDVDHVFGLLSLAYKGSMGKDRVTVDYSKPIADIFAEFAVKSGNVYYGFFLAGTCRRMDSANMAEVPSWVPELRERNLSGWSPQFSYGFNTSMRWRGEFMWHQEHPRVIKVHAVQFDVVESFVRLYRPDEPPPQTELGWAVTVEPSGEDTESKIDTSFLMFICYVRGFIYSVLRDESSLYPNGQTVLEAFAETIVGGYSDDTYPQPQGLADLVKSFENDEKQEKETVGSEVLETTADLKHKMPAEPPTGDTHQHEPSERSPHHEVGTPSSSSQEGNAQETSKERTARIRRTLVRMWKEYDKEFLRDTSEDGLLHQIVHKREDRPGYQDYSALQCRVASYQDHLADVLETHSFIWTKGGYIGLGPKGVEQDDVVAIIGGSRLPFVLRRVEDGIFYLVGPCYVHGIMDGEVYKEPLKSQYEWITTANIPKLPLMKDTLVLI